MDRLRVLNWCFDPYLVLDSAAPVSSKNSNLQSISVRVQRVTAYPLNAMSKSNETNFFVYLQAEREQALRDYKVTIEYKHLKSHAPGGVYIVPSMDSLRKFYGVIFVRRGPFTNGIFKFKLDLPALYNDVNTHPIIQFTSQVYNPYVDPETGILDIKSAYPQWDPARHYLVTVLTFLKKIFYAKTYDEAYANLEAKELSQTNPTVFTTKINQCVHDSQKAVYSNTDENEATLRFSEESLGHRVLRDLLKETIDDPNTVSKNLILTMVEKASKV
jgi:ubiquitin-protein ligase